MIWLNIGLPWKITKVLYTPSFSKLDLCSATSMESSRRDLLNDMAKHRSTLKNNQSTLYSFIFQVRPMFSHINGELSPRPFEWCGWTQAYHEKLPKYVTPPFWFHTENRYSIPQNGGFVFTLYSIPSRFSFFDSLCKYLPDVEILNSCVFYIKLQPICQRY